jgi:poly-beta-1,6-N-acetyl-D-glucosamine synthase
MTSLRPQSSRYVIVSPVKDEERFVENTLQSVANQTVRPDRWVIVDDGSSDGTGAILARFAGLHKWVQVVTRTASGQRRPGSPVINAFYAGLECVAASEYDFIVKLDCDVALPPDYFARLLSKFGDDPRLGIASGVYCEEGKRGWRTVAMPEYHAAGASKVIRARCFAEIGGFVRERGWDTVDEIRAQVRGWQTKHFTDLRFHHLKPEGSAIGGLRTSLMHGEVYYLTGGGLAFLLLKVLHRVFAGAPPVLGGLALLWGSLRLQLSGRERLVDPIEARHYRRLLMSRIRTQRLARFRRRDPSRTQVFK